MYFAERAFFTFAVLYSVISASDAKHPNWKFVDRKKCGKGSLDNSFFRILGGTQPKMGTYPWMALIGRSVKNDKTKVFYYCGGSLINKNYVLTAGHCIYLDGPKKTKFVRLGEHDLKTDKDCENSKCAPPVQDFKPAKLIVHSKFNRKTYLNDIAIIRLDRPAKFNTMVYPICLPYGEIKDEKVGSILKVAGWGSHNPNNLKDKPSVLRVVSQEIVPLIQCLESYPSHFFKICKKSQICAGGKEGYDSCFGDSGGPFMKEEKVEGEYRYFVKGIVSLGDTKCGSKNPAIYTKVAYFINWILDNISA